MSDLAPNHLNHYAIYSPNLASVKLVRAKYHSLSKGRPLNLNHGLRMVVASAMISSLVVAASHWVELRSSAQSVAPQITVTQVAEPTIPDGSTTVSTAAASLPDSKTLQAIINKWQSDYSGGQFGVAVKEINGAERSASLNAGDEFEAASLYKLFLADYLYARVDNGNLSFDDTLTGMPATIGRCIKQMIVVSDNQCGESMGYAIGWPSLHRYVQSAGFKQTTMSPVNTTTAADMAKYLEQLNAGTLIKNSQFSNQLLTNMKVQIYRSAIPAGVPGVTVANKVGFNSNLSHDAAIVYGPKSTYILVVLSTNSSSAAIKDLSTRVANFFNQ